MTLGCRNTRLNELDTNDTKLKDLHADDMMKYQLAEMIRGAVSGMLRAESIYDLLEHAGIGFTFDGVGTQYEELFLPINDRSGPVGSGFLSLFLPRCPNGICISPITGIIQDVTETKSYRVRVLLEVLAEYDCISDFNHRRLPISSISFDALETHQNRKGLVEGVVIVDDVIGNDLAEVLTSSMNALAKHQELSDGVDYHPYSNCIVRDLVHPGLYSYVKGVTSLRASAVVSEPTDSNSQADPSADFWGRRGNRLQVITKIVDYELKPGQRHEGVWHVEGMSHEEIVLTALYTRS
ncbi:hypothetical protein ACHAXN_012783 [Cyclotella atomus]